MAGPDRKNPDDQDDQDDPEDSARDGFADDSIAARLRRFEARGAARQAREEAKIAEDRKPRPLSAVQPLPREDAQSFIDEVRACTSGPKRKQYIQRVMSRGQQYGEGDLLYYPTSVEHIKAGLIALGTVAEGDLQRVFYALIGRADVNYLALFLNLVHWLYLKKQFPWVLEELTPQQCLTLDNIERAMKLFLSGQSAEEKEALKVVGLVTQDPFLGLMYREESDEADESLKEKLGMTTGFSAARVAQCLELYDEDMERLRAAGGDVLDIGCGFSSFPEALRRNGLATYTMDPRPIDELRVIAQSTMDRENRGLAAFPTEGARRFLLEEPALQRAFHEVGLAHQTPALFGANRFAAIFSCMAFSQPELYSVYHKNPLMFWECIAGALEALSPQGGELRMTIDGPYLYTQKHLEKYLLAFLYALQAARFEIPDAHRSDGTFSFGLFMRHYITMRNDITPPMRIRKQPGSDLGVANSMIKKIFIDGVGLDEIIQAGQ